MYQGISINIIYKYAAIIKTRQNDEVDYIVKAAIVRVAYALSISKAVYIEYVEL
jgi:hypothetical protein